MRRINAVSIGMASLVVATVLCTAPMEAQSRPVVYQHGFMSSHLAWDTTARRLEATFAIETHEYDTPSNLSEVTQAQSLTSQAFSVGGNAFGVGHSNGGLVEREANREGGRPWQALISLGTPHAGAFFAQEVLNGVFTLWAAEFAEAQRDPVNVYAQFSEDMYRDVLLADGEFWYEFGLELPTYADGFIVTSGQLLSDIAPSSPFLQTLNSASNLSREASSVPTRIAIVSTLDDYTDVLFRVAFDPLTAVSLSEMRLRFEALSAAGYFYYSNYDDYGDPFWQEKVEYAELWENAQYWLMYLDSDWCVLVGGDIDGLCIGNDGLVTASSASGSGYQVVQIKNAVHTQEPGSEAAVQALSTIFSTPPTVIPLRGNSGALSVGIDGPTSIGPDDSPVWTATVSGGTPAYSYTWTVDGVIVSSGSANTFQTNYGVDFDLGLTVTDAAQATGGATIAVASSGCSSRCPPLPQVTVRKPPPQ